MAGFEVVERGLELVTTDSFGIVDTEARRVHLAEQSLVLGLIIGGAKGYRYGVAGQLSTVLAWRGEGMSPEGIGMAKIEDALDERDERRHGRRILPLRHVTELSVEEARMTLNELATELTAKRVLVGAGGRDEVLVI